MAKAALHAYVSDAAEKKDEKISGYGPKATASANPLFWLLVVFPISCMNIHTNGSQSGEVGTRAIRSCASVCIATVTAAIINEQKAMPRVQFSQRESRGTFVSAKSLVLAISFCLRPLQIIFS